MCTAFRFGKLFGRTLDLEYDLGQGVVSSKEDGADIFGMAIRQGGQTLYFDAANFGGLAGAALNFAGFAYYGGAVKGKINIPSHRVLPYVLARCATVREAMELLREVNITDEDFSKELKATPLHFAFADKSASIAVEQTGQGMQVHKNPVDVLTNAPSFPEQMLNLSNYMQVSASSPQNNLCSGVQLSKYCRGLGGFGLPGDNSSPSRFVRGVFTLKNALAGENDRERLGQFFHIADAVSQVKGCNRLDNGEQVYTVYTSCYDLESGVCYYTTYQDRDIRQVGSYDL